MSFSEIFAIVLGTILGIFVLIPIALFVFWVLLLVIAPVLFILFPLIFIWFLVWLVCKIFKLNNPFDLKSEVKDD